MFLIDSMCILKTSVVAHGSNITRATSKVSEQDGQTDKNGSESIDFGKMSFEMKTYDANFFDTQV